MFDTRTDANRRQDRRADRALYPHLFHRDWRPRTRWDRLWWHLSGEAREQSRDNDDSQAAGQAIDHYQQTLAWRAGMVLDQHAREGWWPGPAPYGYHLTAHRARDEQGRPAWRRRLAVDGRRAPTVPVIYGWSVHDRLSDTAIAVRLAAEHRPAPINHVTGRIRAWSPAAVRTILTQPAYLGYVVRRRTHGGLPQQPDRWVWSQAPVHPALIDPDLFWAAYHRHQPSTAARTATAHPDDEPAPHRGAAGGPAGGTA